MVDPASPNTRATLHRALREDDETDFQKSAQLVLKDGTIFEGRSFGAPMSTSGEVVFNTGMVQATENF